MLQGEINLRMLRQPAVIAGIAAAVLIVVVGYLYMNLGDLDDSLTSLRSDVQQRRANIPSLTDEYDSLLVREAELEAQVAELAPANQEPETNLPTRSDAISTGAILTDFITELNIAVRLFNSEQASETIQNNVYSAITYSLSLRGQLDDLLGVVDLIEFTPASQIKSLSLTKDPAGATLWVLSLSFTVPYQ